MGVVGLDGLFARAQHRGDFLVQQPSAYQAHDVPLPWCQRGDALLQLGVVALAVSHPSILLQRGGNRYPQAVLPSEAHIQDEAGGAVWAWAPQELAGGREGFDLHPKRADEAG